MRKKTLVPDSRASGLENEADDAPMAIVGIGASAGGLEAMESFLAHAQVLRGAVLIVVQHLSPDQPSLLPELLRRATPWPVRAVADKVRLEANCVYVGSPGFDLELHDGRYLEASRSASSTHVSIDALFHSIAACQGIEVAGVVLSGMGSDGTIGLGAIKARAGHTFAQSPETAQFDSMPRSAMQAGVVDAVGSPAELPSLIAERLVDLRGDGVLGFNPGVDDLKALEEILAMLRSRTGHDFTSYKVTTVRRRIERRMALHHKDSFSAYRSMLRGNKGETDLLFKEMLIGVTSFFRDPSIWQHLLETVVPDMLDRSGRTALRIWVAGCSSGEEVYSLAIVLTEALEAADKVGTTTFKIFATDIDGDAIDRARAATYSRDIESTVSQARLARFFVGSDTGYVIRKELREKVVFAIQNVAMDPPFTKLDILVCRNLLIYFEPTLQRMLLPLFHYSLEPGGLLMLGSAETTGSAAAFFTPLPGKFKLYRRVETFRNAGFVAFPATFERQATTSTVEESPRGETTSASSLQRLADNVLLQRYAPAAVVVSKDGDVLYVSGKTGKYLEPAAGRANWNVFAMVREGLSRPLAAAFKEALREKQSISLNGSIFDAEFGTRHVRLIVDPLSTPRPLASMVLIVFADAEDTTDSMPAALAKRTGDIRKPARERDMAQLRNAMRAANEDAQSAEEQARASNEELQSTNEELKSTNEELTTSKEELQSMNEELQTVNQELQSKVDELSHASDDMRNLLNSTEIATVFLDEALKIRRFTAQAISIFKLIPTDVGRPITDITNVLKSWPVADDARDVLKTLVFKEIEVAASDKRWFKVRMMPYRTSDNRIDGVVITLSDISQSKLLEGQLTRANDRLQKQLGDSGVGRKAPSVKVARKRSKADV